MQAAPHPPGRLTLPSQLLTVRCFVYHGSASTDVAATIRTDLMVPDTTLAHLAAACTTRMAERAEAQARHAAAQSAAPAGITQGSLQLR